MRKKPTVSIGPGLFRIYSMCVKIGVLFFLDNDVTHPKAPNPTLPTPTPTPPPPPPPLHYRNILNPSPVQAERCQVCDIASNVS